MTERLPSRQKLNRFDKIRLTDSIVSYDDRNTFTELKGSALIVPVILECDVGDAIRQRESVLSEAHRHGKIEEILFTG